MGEDFLKIMLREYCARDGFCIQLRVDLEWDKEAFDSLTEAMRLCCKHYEVVSAQQQREQMERAKEINKAYATRMQSQKDEEEDEIDLFNPPLPETTRLFPDWLAEMFWHLSHFVRDWTSHKAWDADRAREPEYFRKAYLRLDKLASWFFSGRCPWLDEEKGWASTFVK